MVYKEIYFTELYFSRHLRYMVIIDHIIHNDTWYHYHIVRNIFLKKIVIWQTDWKILDVL